MVQQANVTRCARCGRALKNPKAIAAGMGKTCARKAAEQAAREEMEARQADEARADNIIPFPAPVAPAAAFTVPAGVPVFAIPEGREVWGRFMQRSRTSRVNHFSPDDLVEVRPTGYVFRLRPNAQGLALLMVPAEHVQAVA